jgi:hypothetical protein
MEDENEAGSTICLHLDAMPLKRETLLEHLSCVRMIFHYHDPAPRSRGGRGVSLSGGRRARAPEASPEIYPES